jgi:hypothetical protein
MGWLLKAAAFFVGLVCLGIGLWPVSLLCFGYLGYLLWSATRKRRVHVMGRRGGAPEPPQPQRPALFKKRYIVAGLFFILALVALGAGGTASPFVFLSLGVVTVLSGVLHLGPRVSGVRAVPESILLRSRLFPLSWTSLVEVKFGTTQFARALSSVGNEMIVTATSEKATFYLPVKVIAASAPEADRKVAEKLGPIARSLSARGAYILPLEGKEAASRLNWSLKAVSLAL